MKEHTVKYQIIQKLADGQFHSGEDIGAQLGISRAAISKHIKGIQAWGVDIYRVQGRGYQVSTPIDLLQYTDITQHVSVPVELIPVIDSTNQYLLERVNQLESGSVCIAEYQANGRGRRGRQWASPFGSNLYFSMYWRLDAGMAAAMGLSLVVGVAIVDALESLGAKGVKLKWPNDLYFNDQKLAGILVELSGQTGGAAHLVIGMGLNIKMQQQTVDIDQPWANLEQVFGESMPTRNQIVVSLIEAWKTVLEQYEQKGMLGFVERWNLLDNFKDKPIKLIMGNREVLGIERGINEQGAVLLETEQGVEAFIGGEISLRKAD